ncbi:MAG TPA: DegT/DnrJ/EryC1/StrS family aminotransferase, partial [Armatimonadota bacterium]
GGKPVYSDIDPRTFNLDPDLIEEKITSRTKAILPVHLFGQAADTKKILDIAKRHGLKVVWDGAQAISAESYGCGVGAYGDAVTLSFFPTKNLGGAGDGGMILTNDDELAEKLRYLRFHGSNGSYSYKYVGYCSRLDEIQAAILRVKMKYIDEWTELRRANAAAYGSLLADLDLTLPVEESFNKHVYHQYTIRSGKRDELKAYLGEQGISSGIYYPGSLHLEEAYGYLGYKLGDLPAVETACNEVLSLPVFPEMTDEQFAYVVQGIRSFYEEA